MSRSANAVKNSAFGILCKIINLVLTFLSRTIFIYVLGNTYLGVNGLYTEILNLLSFAELGFGSAMTFAMYKPVADDDEEKILKLLDYYKWIYRLVAGIIAILGIMVIPFLPCIVRGVDWLTVGELRLYFIIYLFNTVIGYFVSYKYSYLNALQKNYVQTNISTLVTAISSFAQIGILLITKSFLAYLIVNSIVLLFSRLGVWIYLNLRYPILAKVPKERLSKEEKQPIWKEVKGLVVHQFASVAVHSTDNILISTLTGAGIVAVGYISNYTMLMNAVLGFVTIIFASVTSGFGNMVAASTTENFRRAFKQINFLNFWVYGFCSVSFWILIPPFIKLWIGGDKLIDMISFSLITINCYLQGQSTIYNNARIAKGNFGKDKHWALVQAFVNLIVSIIGAKYLGLVGIYIGTIVSRMVYVIFRPYSTYRFLFDRSSVEYYWTLIINFVKVILTAFVTYFVIKPILGEVTRLRFIIAVIVDILIINGCFLITSMRQKEYKMWLERIKRIRRKTFHAS